MEIIIGVKETDSVHYPIAMLFTESRRLLEKALEERKIKSGKRSEEQTRVAQKAVAV